MSIAQVHCGMVNDCVCGGNVETLVTFSRDVKNYRMVE